MAASLPELPTWSWLLDSSPAKCHMQFATVTGGFRDDPILYLDRHMLHGWQREPSDAAVAATSRARQIVRRSPRLQRCTHFAWVYSASLSQVRGSSVVLSTRLRSNRLCPPPSGIGVAVMDGASETRERSCKYQRKYQHVALTSYDFEPQEK